jgi:hypothetical protein
MGAVEAQMIIEAWRVDYITADYIVHLDARLGQQEQIPEAIFSHD